MKEKESELKQARLSLTDTTIRLKESERNINHLQENRWSKFKIRRMHPTIFLIQKEFATRAESCQRSVDLKFEECA